MNTVCLAQRHIIYSIVTCNMLSQTESLSKEQKAIFFFPAKAIIRRRFACSQFSFELPKNEKTSHQIYLFYLIRRN